MNVVKRRQPVRPRRETAVRTWWGIWVRVWLLAVIESGRDHSQQRWGRNKWSTRCFHVILSYRKYRWDKVIYSPFPPAGRASFGLKLGKLVLRDITSKLQMPEVDVKHPQKQRKWFPQTRFPHWSGGAFFLLRDRSTRACWWIMLCLYAGVSLFTGDRVFAWQQTSNRAFS